ncbi:MAG: ribonuclease III domain-containing protein [Candidatus Izemoplasmatales bacterium]
MKKEDVEKKIEQLCSFIGTRINKNLATTAITCSGYAAEHNIPSQDSLAIVGDHVIKLLISSSNYKKTPVISKEKLHQAVDKNGQNEFLEKIGQEQNIDKFLLYINTDLEGKKKRATSLEAIIGAVYLSKGSKAVEKLAHKLKILE